MTASEFDSAGYAVGEALRLLAQRGERVGRVAEIGEAGEGATEEPRVVRQRRGEDGSVELTVCRPWAVPGESGGAGHGDHPS